MIWLGCLLGNLVSLGFYFGAGQFLQRRAFPFPSLETKGLTRTLVGEEDCGDGSSSSTIRSVWFPYSQLYLVSCSLKMILSFPENPLQTFPRGSCLIA